MKGNGKRVVIIGGGAAGFFAAISCAEHNPEADILILEKTGKLLTKVAVSGGGRCNVTHNCTSISKLIQNYPRGGKELKQVFTKFNVTDTVNWFEKRGVKLKTESDGRMFPVSNTSETIVNCLLSEARRNQITIRTKTSVEKIVQLPNSGFTLHLSTGEPLNCTHVIIATGGNAKAESYHWLAALGHTIVKPVPSLFTFNVPSSVFKSLQGISSAQASVRVTGTKLEEQGPLLITHWGFSGPAVLRTSAWGARQLAEAGYKFQAQINWLPQFSEHELRHTLLEFKTTHPKKLVTSQALFGFPQRLWRTFTELAEIKPEQRWAELPGKNLNKLVEALLRSQHQVVGKTTFKEEFVTAGGIALPEVNMATMESKKIPGLYFAGEVLDIDGITGGFNFQAAWATGFIAGQSAAAV